MMDSDEKARVPLNFELCVVVANIPLDMSEESVWALVRNRGDPFIVSKRMITDPRGLLLQAAFVAFNSRIAAKSARNRYRILLKEQTIKVCTASEFLEWYSTFLACKNMSVDSTLLYFVEVDCLKSSVSVADLEKWFSIYGKVSNICEKRLPNDRSIARITMRLDGFGGGLRAELAFDNTEILGYKISVRTAVNLARIRSILHHRETHPDANTNPVPILSPTYPQIAFFEAFEEFERLERNGASASDTASSGSNPQSQEIVIPLAVGSSTSESSGKDQFKQPPQHETHDEHSKASGQVEKERESSKKKDAQRATVSGAEGGHGSLNVIDYLGYKEEIPPQLPPPIVVIDYGMQKRVPFRPPRVEEPDNPNFIRKTGELYELFKNTVPEYVEPKKKHIIEHPVGIQKKFNLIPEDLLWIIHTEDWES